MKASAVKIDETYKATFKLNGSKVVANVKWVTAPWRRTCFPEATKKRWSWRQEMFTPPTQGNSSPRLVLLAVAGLLIAASPVLAGPPDVTAARSAQTQSELAAALAEIEAPMTLAETSH